MQHTDLLASTMCYVTLAVITRGDSDQYLCCAGHLSCEWGRGVITPIWQMMKLRIKDMKHVAQSELWFRDGTPKLNTGSPAFVRTTTRWWTSKEGDRGLWNQVNPPSMIPLSETREPLCIPRHKDWPPQSNTAIDCLCYFRRRRLLQDLALHFLSWSQHRVGTRSGQINEMVFSLFFHKS